MAGLWAEKDPEFAKNYLTKAGSNVQEYMLTSKCLSIGFTLK